MKLNKTERAFLMTFVAIVQKMLGSTARSAPKQMNGAKARMRRSAADVALLKKQIRSARKRNISVKAIANELGVTPAYIYQLER
jgi:hypothetical protein